ncbi:ABC transporter substrate-binding protein [Cellulomonas dongxiuzhuiae]|uniref:ABC transporter substrate-binding protein n=1 Tax=Cellulomonas dongxiuzhuiae TaxID=2819979 RepID=UPI001AAE3816|nr:ABC transporter substrate-binding protein [Cellulomonas dongxiuzhuiae]MBO3089534.1 hypothetical protein [Cellulomonas dongxiuzhuiae]
MTSPLSPTRTATSAPRLRAVAGAAAGLLLLTACGGGTTEAESAATPSAAAAAQAGGTLSIGITGEPGNLDPTFAATLTSVSVYNAMCEQLFNTTADGKVVPQLAAEAPTFNEDATVATIKLREGVLFADGTPFDAEAVKFSIERHKNTEGSQRTNELEAVTAVEVVDEHTVDVVLSAPIAPGAFDVIFTDRAGTVVSPTAVAEQGEVFSEAPVCVGPFAFDSRIPQDSVTLVKDTNYYDAENVLLDKVVYRVITDSNVRATNLRAGELQVIERVATTDIATLESDTAVEVQSSEGLGYVNLEINVANVGGERGVIDTPLASDPRVRRALAMSIDRDAINQVVYNGQFAPACGFMAPSSPLATDATQSCLPYDPDAARDLLESTGVDLPLQVGVMLNQQPETRRIGEMIQSMAAEVGFEVVLDIAESTATVERGNKGDFEVYINSWSGRVDPDANVSLYAKSTSPRSLSRFSDARADELIETGRSGADVDARIAAYEELHELLQEESVHVFLVRPANLLGVRTDVTGVTMRANGTAVPTYAGYVAE